MPAEQTYLDVTQGNRVFDLLYDSDLPRLDSGADCPAWWKEVVERADSAPADIVPGLLTTALEEAGKEVRVAGGGRMGARVACVFSSGAPGLATHPASTPTFEVRGASLAELPSLIDRLRGNDLLIAMEEPPPPESHALALGIAGRGFAGTLSSDSTRLEGYVLSTDLAPTILDRLGLPVPSAMSGEPIDAGGQIDPAAVLALGRRLVAIPDRRGPVIGLALLLWTAALALAVAATRGRAARTAVRLAGLSLVYLPFLLLVAAALTPTLRVEQLLAIGGSPLLSLLTLVVLPGYRALALASATTVLSHAIALASGSTLISLSLIGPNPGLGARFYGIGNELEAALTVLVIAGTGAALAALAPGLRPGRAAGCFLAAGLLFGMAFGAGRLGADVGAAIVLPLGGVVAALALGERRRRAALWVVAIPIGAVALLVAADLLSGGNAHLSRSVLEAGGLGDLSDVAGRRIELSAHSFGRPVVLAAMPLLVAVAVLAWLGRARIAGWVSERPSMRAGLLGALIAILAAGLVNDSGALIIEIGAAFMLAFLGFAWAEAPLRDTARTMD